LAANSSTVYELYFNGINYYFTSGQIINKLGSALAGQALIYDGYNYIAGGGGGGAGDNYLASQNLKTDGYVSTQLIKLPAGLSVTSRNFANSGNLSVYSSGTSIVDTQAFGDVSNGTTIINSGASGGAGINLSPGGVQRFSVSALLTLINTATMSFGTTGIFNITDLISGTPQTGALLTVSGQNLIANNSTAGKLLLKGGNITGTNGIGGAISISSGVGAPLDPNINASDGYLTLSRGNNIVASWTDGYSDFISLGSKFNPASTTGNIRLAASGAINFRNINNTGDIAAIYKNNTGTLIINGENAPNAVSLGANGSVYFSVGSIGSQCVMTIADAPSSIMQFQGAGLGIAAIQIHSTSAAIGSPLTISSQTSAVIGGDLYVSSGGSGLGAGPQGRIALQMGGYINGLPGGSTGLKLIELANLGTAIAPSSVLSLCYDGYISATQVPSGNKIIFLGSAGIQPSSNPTGGSIIFAGPNGEFLTRSTNGDMKIGSGSASLLSSAAQTLSLISQSNTGANSRGGLLNIASGTGTPNDINVNASDGYLTLSRGANTVASWTDGYSDYISFGNALNPPSTAGNIRLPKQFAIKARNGNNTLDVSVLSTDGLDELILGGANVNGVIIDGSTAGVNLFVNGSSQLSVGAASISIKPALLQFSNITDTPVITQQTLTSIGNTVGVFSLLAGNKTGIASRGSALVLGSGVGNPLNPNVNASDGYITIQRGANTVASWTDGYSDYISFGSKFKPAATIGNIRVPNNTTIIGALDKHLSTNISVLSINQFNEITLGDGSENVYINAAGIGFNTNSIPKMIITPSLISLQTPAMTFDSTVINSGIFGNSSFTSNGFTSTNISLVGGSNFGLAGRGSAVNIQSGTGVPLDPNINASDGYITILRGNNIIANWTDGYSDFISLGSQFNPPSATGNIRLPNNGKINLRNSTNVSDIAAIQMLGNSLYLNGETQAGGVTLAGGGNPLLSVGISSTQAVMTLTDAITSLMQFQGTTTLVSAGLQIHATSQNTGAPLSIVSQFATVTGGNLYLASGGSAAGTGPQGRVSLIMGGYINGNPSGIGVQMLELANMATASAPQSVLSLCCPFTLSTTQINGNPGNNVMYLGQVITKPPINPTTGILLYSGFNGEFSGKSPAGDFKIGDGYVPMTINGAKNISLITAAASYQSMVGGLFIATATTAPTGNPTGGAYLYTDPADGKLKVRSTSGVTVLG